MQIPSESGAACVSACSAFIEPAQAYPGLPDFLVLLFFAMVIFSMDKLAKSGDAALRKGIES